MERVFCRDLRVAATPHSLELNSRQTPDLCPRRPSDHGANR